MNLVDLQKSVGAFSKEKGFDKSTIEQRSLFLVTEIGEVIREILKISYRPDSSDLDKVKEDLGLEICMMSFGICVI